MRKLRFLDFHSKVYKGFLVSTFSLVFLALNLILVMTYRHIAENTREEEIRMLRNKLYTVAEDMDNQMNSMTNIVMRIVSWKIFRPDYIWESKYHAIEALEQLKGYSDFSDISKNYFIKYEGYDQLFTSGGTTISPALYFEKRQGIENGDAILELLDTLCREPKKGLLLYKVGNTTLFLYPLQVYATRGSNMQGVIAFLVTSADIYDRVEKIAGNIPGDLSMFYDDFCILGDEEMQGAGKRLVSTKVKNYQVYVQMDEDGYFSWKNVFSAREIAAVVGVVMLMLALTAVAAWWNYLPFRKVIMKYGSIFERDFVLDWNDIDDLIKSLLYEKEMNSQLVNEQYQMLREQAIHLIVSGGYSERLRKRLTLLNIDLNYSIFGIIRTSFQKKQNAEDWQEGLYRNIEELSEKGYSLYSYWDSDRTLQILAAAEEEYELVEAVELLQSLFEAMGLNAEVELCSMCRDLNRLHLVKKEADRERKVTIGERGNMGGEQVQSARQQERATGRQEEPGSTEEKREREKEQGKTKSSIKEVVEYIESHCTDYNLSLDMIAQQAQITPQYLCVKLKQEIGMSYKEYLTKLRIEAAKRMLVEEDISVNDVCQKVGYINVSYFIKIFQKYTGVTPTRYRAESRHSGDMPRTVLSKQ